MFRKYIIVSFANFNAKKSLISVALSEQRFTIFFAKKKLHIYGAGFTTLPAELGGVIPGGGSRFSGNTMA